MNFKKAIELVKSERRSVHKRINHRKREIKRQRRATAKLEKSIEQLKIEQESAYKTINKREVIVKRHENTVLQLEEKMETLNTKLYKLIKVCEMQKSKIASGTERSDV